MSFSDCFQSPPVNPMIQLTSLPLMHFSTQPSMPIFTRPITHPYMHSYLEPISPCADEEVSNITFAADVRKDARFPPFHTERCSSTDTSVSASSIHTSISQASYESDVSLERNPVKRRGDKRKRTDVVYVRQPKPPYTFAAIIATVIWNSPNHVATLRQIQTKMEEFFPFFRGSYQGWKDSVRHTLSTDDYFEKRLYPEPIKYKWTLDMSKLNERLFCRRDCAYLGPGDTYEHFLHDELDLPPVPVPNGYMYRSFSTCKTKLRGKKQRQSQNASTSSVSQIKQRQSQNASSSSVSQIKQRQSQNASTSSVSQIKQRQSPNVSTSSVSQITPGSSNIIHQPVLRSTPPPCGVIDAADNQYELISPVRPSYDPMLLPMPSPSLYYPNPYLQQNVCDVMNLIANTCQQERSYVDAIGTLSSHCIFNPEQLDNGNLTIHGNDDANNELHLPADHDVTPRHIDAVSCSIDDSVGRCSTHFHQTN